MMMSKVIVSLCIQIQVAVIFCDVEERAVTMGDPVSLTCSKPSSSSSGNFQWLYCPDETYEFVQQIYIDGRMNSKWRSKCNVTTDSTSSTLTIFSIQPNGTGFYECQEKSSGYNSKLLRVKIVVTAHVALQSDNRPVDSTVELQLVSQSSNMSPRQMTSSENIVILTVNDDKSKPTAFGIYRSNTDGENKAFRMKDIIMIFGIVAGILIIATVIALIVAWVVNMKYGKDNNVRPLQPGTIYYQETTTVGVNSTQMSDGTTYTIPRNQLSTGRVGHYEIDETSSRSNSDARHVYLKHQWNTVREISMNDENLSPMSFRSSDSETWSEGDYWPMVHGGYVEIGRPTVTDLQIVYEPLQQKERRQPMRHILRMFRQPK